MSVHLLTVPPSGTLASYALERYRTLFRDLSPREWKLLGPEGTEAQLDHLRGEAIEVLMKHLGEQISDRAVAMVLLEHHPEYRAACEQPVHQAVSHVFDFVEYINRRLAAGNADGDLGSCDDCGTELDRPGYCSSCQRAVGFKRAA